MSCLCLPNGDDHPEAALKNLLDAGALLTGQRPDGAAYLSGYVVECSLKSLHLLETGKPLGGHDFSTLTQQVSAVTAIAGSKTAKYFGSATAGVLTSVISSWKPGMRYQSPSIGLALAQSWHAYAQNVFAETVHQMRLDGVL